MPKPYSEEWWLQLDARNALRKAIESVRVSTPLQTSDETGEEK